MAGRRCGQGETASFQEDGDLCWILTLVHGPYDPCLTISTGPRLTHNFSAPWRAPAPAVRNQKGRPGSAPPRGLLCLISPALWVPAQGLWPFCCPTFERRVKGLEWESETLFFLKGNPLGLMKSLCQLPSSQMLTTSVASKHSDLSMYPHTRGNYTQPPKHIQHKQCLWQYCGSQHTDTPDWQPPSDMHGSYPESSAHTRVHGSQSLFILHMETPLAWAVQILHAHYTPHTPLPPTLASSCGSCALAPHPALSGLTQVILVQRNLLYQRRHDKGEGLAVEVVQAVASEHGREDHSAVVTVAPGGHGGSQQALPARTPSLRPPLSQCPDLLSEAFLLPPPLRGPAPFIAAFWAIIKPRAAPEEPRVLRETRKQITDGRAVGAGGRAREPDQHSVSP